MKRGFYEILTAFFVVIAVVVAMIWFVNLYTVFFSVDETSSDYQSRVTDAIAFKDNLLRCHGGLELQERKFDDCSSLDAVSGFEVEVEEAYGCTAQTWTYGDVTFASRYVFPLPFVNATGNQCLAKLYIYSVED